MTYGFGIRSARRRHTGYEWFLGCGQSNEVGNVALGALQTEFSDWAPNDLAQFWNGDEFLPLNENPANNEFPQIQGEFGSIFSFMKTFTDNTARRCYYNMYAIGGTGLFQDAAVQDWNVNSTDDMFDRAVSEARQARAKTSLRDPVLFWVQGVKDAKNTTHADAYEDNLNAIFDKFVTELNVQKFIIFKTHNSLPPATHPGKDTVRAAQEAVAAAREDTVIQSTDSYGLAADNIHYNKAGHTTMGQDKFNNL